MKDHHKDKAHPKPKDGGIPYFEKDHWQKDVKDVITEDKRYASEMNTEEEYRHMVDKLSSYARSHKAEH